MTSEVPNAGLLLLLSFHWDHGSGTSLLSGFRVQGNQRFPSALAEEGESEPPHTLLWENKGVLPAGICEHSSKGPLLAESVPVPGRQSSREVMTGRKKRSFCAEKRTTKFHNV